MFPKVLDIRFGKPNASDGLKFFSLFVLSIQGWRFLRILPHLLIFFFWQPMQDFEWVHLYQLHVIASNHDLRRVGGGSEIRRVTAQDDKLLFFFFKICPHPCSIKTRLNKKKKHHFNFKNIVKQFGSILCT